MIKFRRQKWLIIFIPSGWDGQGGPNDTQILGAAWEKEKGEINPMEFSSLEVKVVNNDVERAIRLLKKKIQNDGLFRHLKLKKNYEKPSECRRRKRRESTRRQRTAFQKTAKYSR